MKVFSIILKFKKHNNTVTITNHTHTPRPSTYLGIHRSIGTAITIISSSLFLFSLHNTKCEVIKKFIRITNFRKALFFKNLHWHL